MLHKQAYGKYCAGLMPAKCLPYYLIYSTNALIILTNTQPVNRVTVVSWKPCCRFHPLPEKALVLVTETGHDRENHGDAWMGDCKKWRCHQWCRQWDRVQPQQICWQRHALWGSWHFGGKAFHPEELWHARQVGLCEPHEVQQCEKQGPAPELWQSHMLHEVTESHTVEMYFGVMKIQHEPAVCTHSPESQWCPGLWQKECGQQW